MEEEGRGKRRAGKDIERGAGRKGIARKECGGRDPESLPKRSSEENKRKGREGRNNIKTRESKEKRMEYGEKRRMFFLKVMIGQSSGGANAASDDAQNKQKKMKVSQWERKVIESSLVQTNARINFTREKRERQK